MVWIPIIAEHKIHLEECEERLASNYNFLPNEDGFPIIFPDEESAQLWIEENVKPEYVAKPKSLAPHEEIRAKYLKG